MKGQHKNAQQALSFSVTGMNFVYIVGGNRRHQSLISSSVCRVVIFVPILVLMCPLVFLSHSMFVRHLHSIASIGISSSYVSLLRGAITFSLSFYWAR